MLLFSGWIELLIKLFVQNKLNSMRTAAAKQNSETSKKCCQSHRWMKEWWNSSEYYSEMKVVGWNARTNKPTRTHKLLNCSIEFENTNEMSEVRQNNESLCYGAQCSVYVPSPSISTIISTLWAVYGRSSMFVDTTCIPIPTPATHKCFCK